MISTDKPDNPDTGDAPTGDTNVVPLKPRKCARCKKPVMHEFRPFCSRRCANLDLGNWLNETYRVPVNDQEDGEDTSPDEDYEPQ